MVRLFRTHARDKGLTYPEALDEALCYGWIDGVRRGFDADSFVQRFTPRRSKSKWSAVNLRHYKRLKLARRIQPAGAAAFENRDRDAKPYSFESRPLAFDRQSAAALKANRAAWRFFQSQPPWYRRVSTFLVMSAKREDTRKRRLALLIACSAKAKTIPPLTRSPRSQVR
jgi:uncharacterized protein YdeI (YjbR/CyaY-like superfamily)